MIRERQKFFPRKNECAAWRAFYRSCIRETTSSLLCRFGKFKIQDSRRSYISPFLLYNRAVIDACTHAARDVGLHPPESLMTPIDLKLCQVFFLLAIPHVERCVDFYRGCMDTKINMCDFSKEVE